MQKIKLLTYILNTASIILVVISTAIYYGYKHEERLVFDGLEFNNNTLSLPKTQEPRFITLELIELDIYGRLNRIIEDDHSLII